MVKMKDSGIEWIGEIPEDWKITKFKYETTGYKAGPFGSALITDKLSTEGNILIYTPENVALMTDATDNDLFLPDSRRQEMSQFFVKPGDIIFPIVGSLGRSMKITQNMKPGIINQRLAKFRLDSNLICEEYFLWLFSRSTFYETYIDLFRRGSIIVNLTKNIVYEMPIPIPSLNTQKRIADFLDSKCTKIDSLKNDIEKQIETLEQYKKSVITEAVTKGINPDEKMKDSGIEWIGEIPEHWETKRAKYIFTPRNDRGNKIELQLLSPTQKYGVIPQALYDEISGMNSVKLKENTDFNLLKTCHKGDYCISLRSFQGGFEYSKYEGVVSPAYQIFYPTIKIADGYYKYLFKEKNFIEKINSFTLSLRDGKPISYFDFSNMYLPLPPAEEQKEIANYLDSKCSSIDNIINSKKQQLEKLEEYKKSLIFEYVTGKREV